MEMNYSFKIAEDALRISAPDTWKFIRRVLTTRGGYDDKSSVLAITRLCELLAHRNKNCIGHRIRSLNRRILEPLFRLANLFIDTNNPEHHRSKFIKLGQNDFSILKYWKFIESGSKKGSWKITSKGFGFIMGIPGYAWAVPAVEQCGDTKGNYHLVSCGCESYKPVTCSDFGFTNDYLDLAKYKMDILIEAENESY